jgi:hypothetical protein
MGSELDQSALEQAFQGRVDIQNAIRSAAGKFINSRALPYSLKPPPSAPRLGLEKESIFSIF